MFLTYIQDFLTNNGKFKYVVYITTGIVLSEIFWKTYKKIKIYAENHYSESKIIRDVLFFNEENVNCKDHWNSKVPCKLPICPIINIKYVYFILEN